MKRTILVALAATLALGITACEPVPHRHHAHAVKAVKVKHLHDGRYVYQDDSGVWYWFYIANQSSGSTGYYTGPISGLSSSSIAVAGKGAPPSETELSEAIDAEVDLDVMAEGEPATETANEGASETDASDAGSSDGGSSSSSDGGSSGGDSGGGGDGGGGGGD